ncbi:MAG TPA: NAD-dependent epimerase/dehydratase family protein [Candidatus Saccharimonadales bacterium]|nr:NAD-dependent epimerase/dehydratase family protein [Candidatus Saccharimonadales bacterium]
MEKCLVTGSKGFIGHHLVRYLKNKGHQVTGVDMESDLRNFDNALKATKGIEWVFNLAALNGSIEFTTNNHAELVHNNAMVNLNMAEACYRNGVKRAFFSSSACVYPLHYQETNEIHALKEEDVAPADPDTEYGWEKLFSEHVWKSYAMDRGLEIRIARFINIYGPECLVDTLLSKAPMALTKKVIDAGEGGDVRIWGDGGQKRTFCYISDLLEGIYLLMQSDISEPINLGSNELYSINELVDLIAEIEGIKVKKVHQLDKVQGVRVRQADLTKAETLLGWKRKATMREGLTEVNKYVKSLKRE